MSKGKQAGPKGAKSVPKLLELANDTSNPASAAWKNTVYNDTYRKDILAKPKDLTAGNPFRQLAES